MGTSWSNSFFSVYGGNSTLGFQKIFVLNTATRKDRRHNMEALGRFHKLHMEFAQTFNEVTANALAASNQYLINGTHLACYLSHLQIYRRMVAENIETALVLEDDVDMEIDIKERHAQIMKQVYRKYGGDWDMLYLGHCTTDANEPFTDDLDSLTMHAAYNERKVQLYETKYPMCLHAYAVTLDCAQRLAVLLEERLKTVGKEIDLILAVGVQYGMSTVLGREGRATQRSYTIEGRGYSTKVIALYTVSPRIKENRSSDAGPIHGSK
ncbi:hypothetical protein COEREDRAFT_85120 [Coemansia reversa NRRL 1564]|uniref:Glycosyl transferase family 25 domain-containing protein n=1 Tax=Coemansia reversa (strain ATCC 12441 / NRRL 1564) TaxID=763665 RepID=A0A2G5BI60_COERN|nr:hypothetical protein COEREDRAFT_85120 [Coemansia reversa NRRL 1564]|eukprot:PIA18662.1 hypothetical protein COEREDRAFT_85120 [Coemansia reversa NRRL 1564]